MYQNAVFICISWYSKICRFPMKKCWCQQNSRVASRDSYIFSIVLGWGITVPSFIIAGYVWQIVGRGGGFLVPPPMPEQPRKSPSWIGLRKKLRHRCFHENFAKFLRTPFYRTFLGDSFWLSMLVLTTAVANMGMWGSFIRSQAKPKP